MRRRTLALVAVAVGLVACGGDDEGASTESGQEATSTSADTTTTVPAPAPLTVEEAGPAYLAIVEPYNVALEGLETAVNSGASLDEVKAKADATATANATHIEALRTTLWPTEVQAPIDELAGHSEQAQPFWMQAAQAASLEGVVDAILAAAEHDGAEPAATIRQLLGLTSYAEDDYTP